MEKTPVASVLSRDDALDDGAARRDEVLQIGLIALHFNAVCETRRNPSGGLSILLLENLRNMFARARPRAADFRLLVYLREYPRYAYIPRER